MALGRRERGGTGEAGLRRHGGQTEGWKGKAGGSRLAAFQQVLLPSLPSSCTPVSRASSPRVSLFSFHRLLPRRLSSHPPVRSWKHQPCAFFLMSDILPHRYNKAFWTPSVQNQTSILFRNALNPVTVLLHDRGFKFENNKGSIYSVVDVSTMSSNHSFVMSGTGECSGAHVLSRCDVRCTKNVESKCDVRY
eukprot:1312060-Rhodomonas_salina.2